MAKANGLKYEDNKDIRFSFFPGKRRKIVLEKMTANEKDNNPNLIFSFRMPLTGQPLLGFPSFIGPAYEAVNKEDSLVSEAPLGDFELAGMTIEFFPNEDTARRMLHVTDKTLFKFNVQKEKDGDTFVTVLRFKMRLEETYPRLRFWHDQRGRDIWADFVPTENALREPTDNQMALGEQGQPEQEEEEDAETVGA